jgi:hypothetical protein
MTTINSAGYYNTSRGLLHRVLWEKEYGKIPDKMEINHKDGNKLNNDLDNLELVTHQGNAIHSRRVLKNKGGASPGEKNGRAKLTWEDIGWIRSRKKEYKKMELARMFGVCVQSISNIILNKSWKEQKI